MKFFIEKYKLIFYIASSLFFSFFFYLTWIFYKERMLSFDPSFFSFLIINDKDYYFALDRWGAVFIEFLPLVALKNNCSLETFLRVYSISPIIIYSIVFLLITVGLKNYKAGVALLLSLCLGFRHAFYYATAELYIGIAFAVLLWAIITPEKEYNSIKKYIVLIVSCGLIYIMSYLHQLTLFTVLFILITELLVNNKYKDNFLWALIIFTIAWYSVRIFILTNSDYEEAKIPSFKIFLQQLPHLRYLPSTNYFKAFAPRQFWSLLLVFIISWGLILKTKKWVYAIFLPIYTITFLVLILITYYKGESPLMYENYYTVLGLFASVALLTTLHKIEDKKWTLILLLPLLVINLNAIYASHSIFTKRIEYIDRLVNYGRKQQNKKFLISKSNFPWQTAWVDWAFPFETTLYSAIPGPDSVVTFYVTPDMNRYDSLIHNENIFLGPEWAITWFGSQNLKKNYFNFPSTGYEKLNSAVPDSFSKQIKFNTDSVFIKPEKNIYYSDADSFVIVPIHIKNYSDRKLYSLASDNRSFYLTYQMYNKDETIKISSGNKTPLDIDIVNDYVQGLNVTLPKHKGEYVVKVNLTTKNTFYKEPAGKFLLVVN